MSTTLAAACAPNGAAALDRQPKTLCSNTLHSGNRSPSHQELEKKYSRVINSVAQSTGLSQKSAKTFAVDAASAYCPQYVTHS